MALLRNREAHVVKRVSCILWLGIALAFLLPTDELIGRRVDGGTVRLADVAVGPYLMTVFTEPTPPRPGPFDVSIWIHTPESFDLVEGLSITVDARSESGASVTHEATQEQADRPDQYYAAKFDLPTADIWTVRVTVEGGTGNDRWSDSEGFAVESLEPTLLTHPAVVIAIGLIPLLLISLWLRASPDDSIGDGAMQSETPRAN